jgi:hypothetical protein
MGEDHSSQPKEKKSYAISPIDKAVCTVCGPTAYQEMQLQYEDVINPKPSPHSIRSNPCSRLL